MAEDAPQHDFGQITGTNVETWKSWFGLTDQVRHPSLNKG